MIKNMMILSDLAPDKDSFIEKLFPSGIEPFIVQLLAMAVIVIAFFVFFFKPVRKMLNARSEKMMSEITEAEKKNANAQALLTEAETKIKNSKNEAQMIVEKAKKEAETIKEEKTLETKEEVRRMKAEAAKDIEMSKIQAQEDINKAIVEVAMSASSKVLEREVTASDNKKIIDDFLSEIDK